MRRYAYIAAICIAACILVAGLRWRSSHRIHLQSVPTTLAADGRSQPVAKLVSEGRGLVPEEIALHGTAASAITMQQQAGEIAIIYRPPVNPGTAHLQISARGRAFALRLTSLPADTDTFGDGTPDWMRLHAGEDRSMFRRWFTELAERMADMPQALQPAEIADCASLLRYSYREALRVHDDKWYRQFGPVAMPALASVQQWSYPNTPLGTGLFRITTGPYTAADHANGAFQAFADAKTLMLRNTAYLGRDIRIAQPGDLIFYRVLEQDSQYHSMILTGDHGEWVVYHTGPIDKHRGEMRRVLMADLMHHPNPKWHPVPDNPNFLGVFRWNILREE